MYSNDINFFLEHQIAVSTTNNGKNIRFYSRLNGELFEIIDHNQPITDQKIEEVCNKIFNNLKN